MQLIQGHIQTCPYSSFLWSAQLNGIILLVVASLIGDALVNNKICVVTSSILKSASLCLSLPVFIGVRCCVSAFIEINVCACIAL